MSHYRKGCILPAELDELQIECVENVLKRSTVLKEPTKEN